MAVTKISNSGILTGTKKYDSMLAGNAAYDPGATWLIERVTTSSTVSTITFSSIPSTYQHLQIRGIAKEASTGTGADSFGIRLNSDSGANYTRHWLYGDGSAATAAGAISGTQSVISYGVIKGGSLSGNGYGASIIDIHDYANTTKNKTIRSFNGADVNGSGIMMLSSGLWLSTSAVTSITLVNGGNGFASGSTFALYGFTGA